MRKPMTITRLINLDLGESNYKELLKTLNKLKELVPEGTTITVEGQETVEYNWLDGNDLPPVPMRGYHSIGGKKYLLSNVSAVDIYALFKGLDRLREDIQMGPQEIVEFNKMADYLNGIDATHPIINASYLHVVFEILNIPDEEFTKSSKPTSEQLAGWDRVIERFNEIKFKYPKDRKGETK